MTVRELIEALSSLDPDSKVGVEVKEWSGTNRVDTVAVEITGIGWKTTHPIDCALKTDEQLNTFQMRCRW
jgi:hypothetical protein